jgi:CRISPR-associated endonuclease Csn1
MTRQGNRRSGAIIIETEGGVVKEGSMVESGKYILGLDIGTNSLGWALVGTGAKGWPVGIAATGVRVFPAGVKDDIESGRDASRAVDRRTARSKRRLLDRRTRRLAKLARLLQSAALLPPGDLSTGEARHKFFQHLDATLFPAEARHVTPHTLVYGLRKRALDEALQPNELGRALYHLAQRRGFLSNRLVSPDDEDESKQEEGLVKAEIAGLAREMKAAGARTLGEYLCGIDPEKERRIRERWTARQMYLDEFEAIWDSQRRHAPALLTDDLKKRVYRAIFYQRPLKWKRSTIGMCELEPRHRRAPLALLDCQRYRLLQKVNDLRLLGADPKTGEMWPSEKLDEDRRAKLVAVLEEEGDLAFSKFHKLLALPKWVAFNYKEAGETKLIGNRTACKLRGVFGDRWATISREERDREVEDLRSIKSEKALQSRAERFWKLDAESASRFSKVALEGDYCSLSRQALNKLLPLMERGVPYTTARKQVYGDRPVPKPLDALPALDKAPLPPVRNPAVLRALSETRKVVNGLLRKFGKPTAIRIELARDLKRGRKERQAIWKDNQANRKKREQAAQKLLQEHGIANASRKDVEKWLLADECGWRCPYTGEQISGEALFGPQPRFDVEHIIPFSRLLDDSFLNKTLCLADENRHSKHTRTPWEAYGQDAERWTEIIQRVNQFQGPAREQKLRRFQLSSLDSLDDFTNNQLSDTRYASRLAIEYLGLLYGTGAQGVDADHTKRIQAGRGSVTKYLRDEWGLNKILNDGGEKSRDDHRHHAVDAICIALTDNRTVQMLSTAAAQAESQGRRRFVSAVPPWPGFFEEAQERIRGTIVSHRTERKVRGPLHDETFYSAPKAEGGGKTAVHVRVPLAKLGKQTEAIVDPAVRGIVAAALDGGDPKKVFADRASHPAMPNGALIHAVRIKKSERAQTIGRGARQRQVITRSNHHLEVIEAQDEKGRLRWEGKLVSMLEAAERLRRHEPVVQRDHGPGRRFLFSLSQGDLIELDLESARGIGIFVVRTIYMQGRSGTLEYVENRDAREKRETRAAKARHKSALEPLRKMNCRKVSVSPLGEVRYAHD